MRIVFGITIIVGLFFLSCQFTNASEASETKLLEGPSAIKSIPIEVKVRKARVGSFPLKIITNGTLQALQKVELRLEAAGKIIQLAAREGVFVDKNKLLLQLDDQAQQYHLKQLEITLQEAEVNKADLLIANGGRAFEDSTITADKLRYVNTLSGYTQALHDIEIAKYELTKTKLYVPFSGYIADVNVQKDQQVDAGETICTLINPASFEAVFTLLEEQALKVQKGQSVKIYPLSGTALVMGEIIAINPIVNEQGLVKLYAKLLDNRIRLFEGMNVRVIIEQAVANQIIIPKTAVVLRSDRPVVFTYAETEQRAKWNYVTISYENDTSIAISEGLDKEDNIIYDGNLNLDHDAEVIEQKE